MKTLEELAHFYATDKRKQDHNYTEIYEKHFSTLRDAKMNICEIGILNHPDKINRPYGGASLLMWRDYFYNSGIHGIDINDHSYLKDESKIRTYIADQSDRKRLKELFGNNQMDIIIDDGGHWMHHQQVSLGCLFKNLKSGGIYVIEDLGTSHPDKLYHGEPSIWRNDRFKQNDEETLTLDMLYEYQLTKRINSNLILQEEIDYLNENISECIIEEARFSPIAFLYKK